MQTVRTFTDKNELQKEFKRIMHAIDIECFGIKYKKCKKVIKKMSKHKHRAVKELSDIVKEHKKENLNEQDKIKSHKSLQMKIQVVDEIIRGPKHKKRERAALFDPKTSELLTDENEILEATLQYNIGVLTKNKVAKQDMDEVKEKTEEHDRIMKGEKTGDKLNIKTWRAVLKHIKKKNKNMFRHLNKAGEVFKYAVYIFVSHLMNNELVRHL